MDVSQFPTTLADLSLNDSGNTLSLYANLKSLRKSALSIPNRLQSILDDGYFVKQVRQYYKYPLVANERCGSWYINPVDKEGSAYFKSTDGHHGQWDFSARRLNLQLLPVLSAHGGAILVDSTRRGKNLPDAFSKTAPIWVAVLNRVLFPDATTMHSLQTPPPPDTLGASEISQIEAKLGALSEKFRSLSLDLQDMRNKLKHPIQVSWAINGSFDATDDGTIESPAQVARGKGQRPCHHLVLCSASRRVRGAEISEQGYVQGAGDDSEGWSHGLTAQLFWEHKALLLQTSEDELPGLIAEWIQQHQQSQESNMLITRISPTSNIYITAGFIDVNAKFDLVIDCERADQGSAPKHISLACRPGKLGSKDLRDKLPSAISAVCDQLAKSPESQVVITCSTGKDFSVGVAVAALCLLYDDQGMFTGMQEASSIDKHLVRRRLAWITCSKPDANPSRATLQAVNSFLMPPPE